MPPHGLQLPARLHHSGSEPADEGWDALCLDMGCTYWVCRVSCGTSYQAQIPALCIHACIMRAQVLYDAIVAFKGNFE